MVGRYARVGTHISDFMKLLKEEKQEYTNEVGWRDYQREVTGSERDTHKTNTEQARKDMERHRKTQTPTERGTEGKQMKREVERFPRCGYLGLPTCTVFTFLAVSQAQDVIFEDLAYRR